VPSRPETRPHILLDKAPLLCYVETMSEVQPRETKPTSPAPERGAFARLAEQHEVALERAGGCYEPEGEGVQA